MEQSVTPAMTARYQGVAVAPGNGLIYVIGGWNNSAPTSVVEAYDPVGNTWTSEASLGHSSGCSVGGAINGLIYVLTGCDGNAGFSNEFDVYNPATNTWTSLSSPPTRIIPARVGSSAANSMWRVGTTFTDATGITEVYDPQTSAWTTVSPMPAQLGELGGAVFSGNLYVVGGLDNSSTAQPDVYVYNAQAIRGARSLFPFRGTPRYRRGGLRRAALRRRRLHLSDSNTLEVLDTDDVTWASDTTSVATVDPNAGLATGVSAGTANITATSASIRSRAAPC